MFRMSTLVRVAVVAVVVGLLAHLGSGEGASWAAPDQDIERQTVPTRTPTPAPVTPTVPPPTPKPGPTATAAPTVVSAPTLEASEENTFTLPNAGSGSVSLSGAVPLLVSGALLLLAGRWAIRSRRRGAT